jgi:hypothetical protein
MFFGGWKTASFSVVVGGLARYRSSIVVITSFLVLVRSQSIGHLDNCTRNADLSSPLSVADGSDLVDMADNLVLSMWLAMCLLYFCYEDEKQTYIFDQVRGWHDSYKNSLLSVCPCSCGIHERHSSKALISKGTELEGMKSPQ